MGYQRRVHGEFTAKLRTVNMLLFLSLLSTALAAPQFYSPYYGYPMYGGYPSVYPGAYPGRLVYPVGPQAPVQSTRGLVKVEAFKEINGEFETSTTPVRTVTGTFTFQQNFLTDITYGNNAFFKVHITAPDLTGKNVMLLFGASCTDTTTATQFASINGPITIGQGFYVSGGTTGFNIEGNNGKTSLKNMWLQVSDSTGIIGCSKAALA